MSYQQIITAENVDPTNCDREQIHIPGSIQPHGVMLVLSEPELSIVQVSSNTWQFLGREPEEILDRPLRELLDKQDLDSILSALSGDFDSVNPLKVSIEHPQQGRRWFDGIVHNYQKTILLELEPSSSELSASFFDFYRWVKKPLARMQNASSLSEFCQVVAEEVRQITGFDRAMVYQFDSQGIGTVISEDKREDLEPYLNLRYPASDVPKQARELYLLNLLRIIPNRCYEPVKLVPELNPITDKPLDMSLSVLRSVSPLHVEYMTNMGVSASMSVSLIKDKKLWGLVACHHYAPKQVSYEVRTVCEFLARAMSFELSAKQDQENFGHEIKLKSIQSQFIQSLSQVEDFVTGLTRDADNLLDLVEATGVMLWLTEQVQAIGNTPTNSQVRDLIDWIETNIKEQWIYHTDSLPAVYPPARAYKEVASGLLALCLSKVEKIYILWFRPEVIQTVNWGGDPNKAIEISQDGSYRLSPRKSFALWQETVRFKSLPWKPIQLEAARELGGAIVGIVLRKAEELAKINRELERSNQELDAFAYIASHDLKEPLRGIHNYSNFLLQDYAGVLEEDGVGKLQTLVRLTQHMEDLIDSLLHFSRLGRVALSLQPTNLNDVIKSVLDIFQINAASVNVEIRIPRPLPVVRCDRTQVKELFTNLISNSLKYNDKPQKWVEIGFVESRPAKEQKKEIVFYIKDNGIGIKEKHLKTIFRIFKRLHPRDKYGGGTGAGLTIAQKIVERHDGEIWVESIYGEGSTFYFTLPN